MPSIVTVNDDWLKGIAKYLTIGAMILSRGNMPIATAIATTDILFKSWRASQKKDLIYKKKIIEAENGICTPIIPIDEYEDEISEEPIQEIFEKISEKGEKLKRKQRKNKRKKKKGLVIEFDGKGLRIPLKLRAEIN